MVTYLLCSKIEVGDVSVKTIAYRETLSLFFSKSTVIMTIFPPTNLPSLVFFWVGLNACHIILKDITVPLYQVFNESHQKVIV